MERIAVVSRLVVTLAAASLVAGCAALGSNYSRPQVPSPPAYRFIEGAPQAESLADAPWFRVFEDPVLQALIRDALANNLDLQAAVARVEEARARAGIAKSFLYPQVDGVASYAMRGATSSKDQTTGGSDAVHQSAVYGFQLSWELDLFGKLRRQHEAALAIVLATDQARRGVIV